MEISIESLDPVNARCRHFFSSDLGRKFPFSLEDSQLHGRLHSQFRRR